MAKVHKWRLCPEGKHWVSAHSRNRVSSRGIASTQWVNGFCRSNPSGKDHLYKEEILEIAKRNFSKLTGPPNLDNFQFKARGNKYDDLIRGWTRYWNEVLGPADPLDANVVKALIATESSFIPTKWNRRKGKKAAYGLMQMLDPSVQLLKDSRELRDHFVNLDDADMNDPSLAICAGIRWLFRKKELLEKKTRKPVSWRDAIASYKGVQPTERKLMPRFDKYLERLRGKK